MSGTIPLSAVQAPNALETLLNDFANVKGYCQQIQTATASGGAASSSLVLNALTWVLQLQADWNGYQANTNLWNALIAYVQTIYGNSGVTTTTFQNAFNAAGALATAIETDYPHTTINSVVYLLDRIWNGSLQAATLTAAQLPNTMPAITAYLATLS